MRTRSLAAVAPLVVIFLSCLGSSGTRPVYRHNRIDYRAFQEAWVDLPEPNYLPFMAHWMGAKQGSGALVFCRWAPERFPLAVHVTTPEISEEIQDEFHPRPAADYVAAAEDALSVWERGLGGLVSFRAVGDAAQADLVLQLVPDRAPTPDPDFLILGATRLGDACQEESSLGRTLRRGLSWLRGASPNPSRPRRVRFDVPRLQIFLVDGHGLLTADQVHRIALHEIGHALGMRSHSPIPADLMYEIVRDRVVVDGLSIEDINSFVSLYSIPNGTVYRRLGPDAEPAPSAPAPRSGNPELELAPHVDARLGFEVQTPRGWLRLTTGQGLVAVDGIPWDYTASLQIIVRRYPSVGSYLERNARRHVGGGTVIHETPIAVAGRPGLRLVVEHPDEGYRDTLSFLDSGDGRVFVVIAESPLDQVALYERWFEATLTSLEIWATHSDGVEQPQRDYRRQP